MIKEEKAFFFCQENQNFPWHRTLMKTCHLGQVTKPLRSQSGWASNQGFPGALLVESPAAHTGDTRRCAFIQSLRRKDALEEGMATHSSILSSRTPWTEEPGGL